MQNLENIGCPHLVFFARFFSAQCDFFWIPPKGFPFVCFDILQHNGCQKIPKGPSFTFFGTVTLFENLIKNFFPKFFKISQRSPFNFFLFCTQLEFHKAQRVPPFTILSLRCSTDFGRTRLVFSYFCYVRILYPSVQSKRARISVSFA